MQTGNTYVADSRIHGRGTFSKKALKKGETIQVAIENAKVTPFGKLINHSYCPNTELQRVGNASETYVLVALRDIVPGEELAADYRYSPEYIVKPDPRWGKAC